MANITEEDFALLLRKELEKTAIYENDVEPYQWPARVGLSPDELVFKKRIKEDATKGQYMEVASELAKEIVVRTETGIKRRIRRFGNIDVTFHGFRAGAPMGELILAVDLKVD